MEHWRFDALGHARRLKEVGMPEEQAEAVAAAMVDLASDMTANLVTREYLDARLNARFAEQDARIDARFARQDIKINTLTVMVAAIFAATVVPALARLFG